MKRIKSAYIDPSACALVVAIQSDGTTFFQTHPDLSLTEVCRVLRELADKLAIESDQVES